MRKIGILTLNGYRNFGNRLQNYALKQTLEKFGFHVDTIIVNTFSNEKVNIFISKLKKGEVGYFFKWPFLRIRKHFYDRKFLEITSKKTKLFKDFSNKNLNEKFVKLQELKVKQFTDQYSFFVVGSDQVWNPYVLERSKINLLFFVNGKKRIAYAPSFGVTYEEIKKFPMVIEDLHKHLKSFKSLSVREETGQKVIQHITGEKVPIVADPTILLTKKEWLDLAEMSSSNFKKKFILLYFLGEINKEIKNYIHNLSQTYNLDIINFYDINSKEHYVSSPIDFLNYIRSSEIILTDSFHGSIFSILMEKPFIVFKRSNKGKVSPMYSRLETLLKTTDFSSRQFFNLKLKNDVFDINYNEARKIIENERKKGEEYLKKALDLGEKNEQ